MAATYIETTKLATRENSRLPAGFVEKTAEGFWFLLCLLLFVILGPFSAPIALAFLFFDNHLNTGLQEPEPLQN